MYDAKAKLKSKTVNIVAGKYVFQELHTLVHFAIVIIIIIIIIEGSKDLSVKVDYG